MRGQKLSWWGTSRAWAKVEKVGNADKWGVGFSQKADTA